MNNLYERIFSLCSENGIKPGKMCTDLGISRGNISDLKMGRIESLSADKLAKIATYFKVSVDYLLTGEETKKAPTDGEVHSQRRRYYVCPVGRLRRRGRRRPGRRKAIRRLCPGKEEEKMMDLMGLYRLAEDNDIAVDCFELKKREALSVMDSDGTCYIAIDPFKLASELDEKMKLGHELGHSVTGIFYNEYATCDVRRKHENRADKWAINEFVSGARIGRSHC